MYCGRRWNSLVLKYEGDLRGLLLKTIKGLSLSDCSIYVFSLKGESWYIKSKEKREGEGWEGK
jgi:hypothetical protein